MGDKYIRGLMLRFLDKEDLCDEDIHLCESCRYAFCKLLKEKKLKITKSLLGSITDTQFKCEVIEATFKSIVGA